MICWDRGRPARNAPKVRRVCTLLSLNPFSRCTLCCGQDARGPSNHLNGRFEIDSLLRPLSFFTFTIRNPTLPH